MCMKIKFSVEQMILQRLRIRGSGSQCWGAASFYAAPAPGKNYDAAPAAPAPTWLYSKAKFWKRTLVQFLTMFNTIVGAGAVGAGAIGAGVASCYGSGSNQIKRLLTAPAPQHCRWLINICHIQWRHCSRELGVAKTAIILNRGFL
jgi:hypothetical protein